MTTIIKHHHSCLQVIVSPYSLCLAYCNVAPGIDIRLLLSAGSFSLELLYRQNCLALHPTNLAIAIGTTSIYATGLHYGVKLIPIG